MLGEVILNVVEPLFEVVREVVVGLAVVKVVVPLVEVPVTVPLVEVD